LARIELRTEVVEVEQGATYHIVVGCSGDAVTIAVAAPGGRARFRNTDLASAPPGVRPRIVALVAAELVRHLALAPAAPVVPPHEIRLPPPDSRPNSVGDARLGAFAAASTFGFDGRWLFGGGLRFAYAHRWLCGGLDAAFLTGSDNSARGTTSALLTYLSPHVGGRFSTGGFSAEVDAGLAFGAARMSGHPSDATTVGLTLQGPWMAPYGALGLGYGWSDAFTLEARMLGGWVTVPVVGETPGGREFGLKGFFSAFQLGLALSL
jgi:hypothetical protein